ncbi:MAG: elongation factor-1 alpha [Deltaproteobacteria bacterium]|nr:elongation factor-1 alpha [Deltaproteobacteria bacterium]
MPSLSRLDPALRSLFTGYLIIIGLGLLMSFGQILLTHGMADGKLGLSVDDVVYSYYGNREGSRLETKLQGSMKLMADEQTRAALVQWVRKGSPEAEWDARIGKLVAENCTRCHGVIPGIPDYTQYAGIKTVTEIDEGATVPTLARVSHIHLFGIAFIFFFVCGIFTMAEGVPSLLRVTVVAFPYVFLGIDVFSWWATKWVPSAAYLTVLAGTGYALSSGFMILTSLWQMWRPGRSKKDA